MPELPEVETVRRALDPVICGRTITDISLNRTDLRVPVPDNFKAVTQGASATSTTRRGKYAIIHLDNKQAIIIHLGMSGQITIHASAADYEPRKHDHIVFTLDDKTIIAFNDARRFGFIVNHPMQDLEHFPSFKQMGPEPLGNEFNAPELISRLKTRTSPIKTALLDQRVVSGIGNIYACEALYRSGISPTRKASSITGQKAEKLVQAIKDILREAIEAGGSSLKDYVHTDGSLGYFQHGFAVYGREGEICPSCQKEGAEKPCIKRIVQSARSTFYCPRKQR